MTWSSDDFGYDKKKSNLLSNFIHEGLYENFVKKCLILLDFVSYVIGDYFLHIQFWYIDKYIYTVYIEIISYCNYMEVSELKLGLANSVKNIF